MSENPRFSLLVAKHGRTLVIALTVIGLLTLVAAGWVVATPSTTSTSEEVDRQTVSTDASTSAVVVEGGLWEEGTVLEDSSVYPLEATPELTLEAVTSLPTDETSVDHEFDLVYRANYDGDPFWEETEPLEHTTSTEDGEHVSTATVDLPTVYETYSDLEGDLPDGGSLAVSIRINTTYETGSYEGTLQGESPLELSGDSYRVSDAGSLSDSEEHSTTQSVEVTEPPNMALVGLFVGCALLSFGGGAFIASRSEIDEEAARLAVHRQRYADWISNGSLPMWVGDHHVALDTLEDVVDVAIDSNERVVYDKQRQLFAVVNDEVVYYYSDRGLWEETAWPEMTFPKRASETDSEFADAVAPVEGPEEVGWAEETVPDFSGQDGGSNESPDDEPDAGGSADGPSFGDDGDGPDFSDDEDVWRQL